MERAKHLNNSILRASPGMLFLISIMNTFFSHIINIHEQRLPIASGSNNLTVTDKYVKFTISDLETDLGQTTIPFFDIQDVTAEPPKSVRGFGLYYKYFDNKHSGFVGIQLKVAAYERDHRSTL